MFKRILLFVLTNVLVIATISIVTSLLGLHPYLSSYGLDYKSLAIFCAIWGTAGAFISLFMSKYIAKKSMGLKMIDPNQATTEQKTVLEMVYGLAKKAGLPKMPEVGIYDSPELNAFATGPTKKDALVGISTGLLQKMNDKEVEGVVGHEITHVANGDMVTMTFIMGIVNAFSLFLSRIIAFVIAAALSRREKEHGPSMGIFYLLTVVFDVLFTLLGTIVVAAFSRWREYRADAGGARLAGRDNMIAALEELKNNVQIRDNRAPTLQALKISQPPRLMTLFASHPPLEKRIERLRKGDF